MADAVGKQFGNYRLLRLLGQGGFADVYLGEHIYLKTQAAIKLLQARLAQDDLETFLKEARAVSGLVHPHIIRVLEFGVENTTPFLVMDYAPNGTLRQRHPKGTRLPPAAIVPYLKQVAAALQYAHDRRIIHRDVKPENMLLSQNNEVLLSDFGIALVAQSSRYQQTQEVAGTIAYMAPEQLQGRSQPASDQYALGITVFEWLSGERPFQGSFPELASQHLVSAPPLLRNKIPGIPPAIDEVVQRAIAKDPQQRFTRVEAFANAFEQASQPGWTPAPYGSNAAIPPPPPPPFVANALNSSATPNFAANPPGPLPLRVSQPLPSSPNYPSASFGPGSGTTFVVPPKAGPPPNNANTTSAQFPQAGSFTSPAPRGPEPPKQGVSRRKVVAGIAGVAALLVVGGGAALFELTQHQNGTGGSAGTSTATSAPPGNTPTSGSSPVATNTSITGSNGATSPTAGTSPTVESSPTTAPTPGVLYQSDWSSGLNGWAGSSDWKVLNGVLLNDGTAGNMMAGPTIVPPYQLGSIADYALEAKIQVVSYQNGNSPEFGMALRGTTVSNNWQGYQVGISYLDASSYGGQCYAQITTEDYSNVLTKTPFDPQKSSHVLRFEAQGNVLKFFIDGGNVLQVTDNKYLTGSQIGLWCYHAELSVTSFKIIAL